MIEMHLKDSHNQPIGMVQLSDTVFGRPRRDDLLSLTVHYQLAKRRAGTASTKGRADVAGGGKKPYRQKGTGNARQGTIRAPQYRTGGIVFGPHPRDYSFSLPKKVRRLSLQTALSLKRELNEITIIDGFDLTEIKTKHLLAMLTQLGVTRSALIVIAEDDDKVQLSARNLPGISVIKTEGVNVYDLLSHHMVILTKPALQKLEERLA